MKLTIEERKMAAAASAETAPSALVAEIQPHLASSPTASVTSALTAASGEGRVVIVRGSTPIKASTPIPVDKIAFFGPGGRRCLHRALDLAVVKLICVARLPPSLVDLDEWKELFALQTPSYHPASRTTLMENQIMSEQEHVRKSQIAILETKNRLSLSFDGGSIRSGESLYTVHATTAEERRAMLLEGQECTSVSHTGAWIAELVLRVRYHYIPSSARLQLKASHQVIDQIGRQRFIAISSDNTGNTRLARQIVTCELPLAFNLPDPAHHLNNTWKDIANLSHFKDVTTYFLLVLLEFNL